MATLIEKYEAQFGELNADITHKISRLPKVSDTEKNQLVQQIRDHFNEAKDLLEQIELETADIPADARAKFSTRILCYKREMETLQKHFTEKQANHASYYMEDDNAFPDDHFMDSNMKTQLLQNTSRLDRSTNKLKDGLRSAIESEEIGANILADLSSQRETLHRSRDRLREAQSDLSRSGRIISDMTKRIFQNRVILVAVIFIMVMIFVGVLYMLMKRSSSYTNVENMEVSPVSKPPNT